MRQRHNNIDVAQQTKVQTCVTSVKNYAIRATKSVAWWPVQCQDVRRSIPGRLTIA